MPDVFQFIVCRFLSGINVRPTLSDSLLHRPQFQQYLKPIVNISLVGGFQKRKRRHVAQFQGGHAQNHGGEVAADDFGVGERGALVEIVFAIQADWEIFST